MSGNIISSPINDELRGRVKELRTKIRMVLDEWYTLQNIDRPRLLAEYDRHYRDIEIEIQRKTLESSEIGRRVELLTIKRDRGEKLTPEIISLANSFVDKEFAQFHKRINEAYSMTEEQRIQSAINENNTEKDGELPKLYRAIVKKLHPDVSTENDDFSKFWHTAQEAFTNKNLQKMQSLYTLICLDEDENTRKRSDLLSEEDGLQADIKELEIRLERETRKLNRLKNEEPFTLENKLHNSEWLKQHFLKLENELYKKNAEIKQFKLLMELLTGEEWQQTHTDKISDEQNFEQEFTNSTYFSGR